MSTPKKLCTADDLWALSHKEEGQRCELIRGELVEMTGLVPGDETHRTIVMWIDHLILDYVDTHDLGEVTPAGTGFILSTKPDTVRVPDVGFIAKARLKPLTGAYYPFAPDLAVEVVSPDDTANRIRRKITDYLDAGTRLVWIVYPDSRLIDVYAPDRPLETVKAADVLGGSDVLPGLSLPVQNVFKKLK
jgi:Uma2 family endonuclease